MARYIFDIETDGFLDECSKVHSLVLVEADTGKQISCANQTGYIPLQKGLDALTNADEIIGHNIIKFDLPVLNKIYPQFRTRAKITDTLVLTRLLWPHIKELDYRAIEKKIREHPANLCGSHSLKAWGYRLRCHKGHVDNGFDRWTPKMQTYCEQDVEVTHTLYRRILKKGVPERASKLEHDIAHLMWKQEQNGFCFDIDKATLLLADLNERRLEIESELQEIWPPEEEVIPFYPKVNNSKLGYEKGKLFEKKKIHVFNPSSRKQVGEKLIDKYGWEPEELTENNLPKVDETVLNGLPYPEAKLLAEYFLLQKRLGQLSDGRQAWLKVERDGKIHGSVITNGTVSGRASHAFPNIAQVPSTHSPYGDRCRELFHVPQGWKLVGADMSGLELRALAAELHKFDKGAYAQEVINGDIHEANKKAAGLNDRSQAKTFIYAFLYGGSAKRIGSVVGGSTAYGATLIKRFLKATPAIAKLRKAVERQCEKEYLVGLDGRYLHVRSPHSAVNLLLQSHGAVLCKQWLLIVEKKLALKQLSHGWDGDYAFCAWVHDEVQISCKEHLAELIGEICVEACAEAGKHFDFACPLDGQFKIGDTWKETH